MAAPTTALFVVALGVPRADMGAFAIASGIHIVAACAVSSLLASRSDAWAGSVPVVAAVPNPFVLGYGVEALVQEPVLALALLAVPAAGTWVVARRGPWLLVKGGTAVRVLAGVVVLLGWVASVAVTLFAVGLGAVE